MGTYENIVDDNEDENSIEYSPLVVNPIHGCNETSSDAKIEEETATGVNESNPTYSYFTEETTAAPSIEETTVEVKSYEDIQPKALPLFNSKKDIKSNSIESDELQGKNSKLSHDTKLKEKEIKEDLHQTLSAQDPITTTEVNIDYQPSDKNSDNGTNVPASGSDEAATAANQQELTTETPFIVYPEENEIPDYGKPSAKELSRSTTVSYSIVRPVATYHI